MRRIILMVTVAAVMAAMMALAGPAFANHDYNLETPGTTVSGTTVDYYCMDLVSGICPNQPITPVTLIPSPQS
jgi:hypothetical protein